MKALSIKQPWAYLIAAGIKDIENRTWKTKFRGTIYIHASMKPAFSFQVIPSSIFSEQQWWKIPEKHQHNIIRNRHSYGAIIGEVDIIDCVINHPSIWAEKTRGWSWLKGKQLDNIKPIHNWVLANPILYDEPILDVKGKLSFWEYEKPQ